ncbi:MAG: Xaa-Pro peptidase family protein [Thermoplasmatota archaeon]
MKERIENIFNNSNQNLDCIIIKNSIHPFIDDNFFYVTGLSKGIYEGSVAILYPDGSSDVIVSELEAESAKQIQGILHVYRTQEEFQNKFKELTSSYNTIGLNYAGLSHHEFCRITEFISNKTFIDISKIISQTRLIKDNVEISLIRKACKIVDMVMKKIPQLLFEGVYEYEIAAEIEYLMMKNGADRPAFETISSFNTNTAEPHYTHGNNQLHEGDLALFDFGACVKKYNSDITRTFVYGSANKKQKEIYKTVKKAQEIGFEMIQPGITGGEVHKRVKSYIDSTEFKGKFIHSTGHSLGIAVHDAFLTLNEKSNLILQENMILTIEPGIYIERFGGVRIEDDILITKNGMELLTTSSRELTEVVN